MRTITHIMVLDLWHNRTWFGRILFAPLWALFPFIVLLDVFNFIERKTRK